MADFVENVDDVLDLTDAATWVHVAFSDWSSTVQATTDPQTHPWVGSAPWVGSDPWPGPHSGADDLGLTDAVTLSRTIAVADDLAAADAVALAYSLAVGDTVGLSDVCGLGFGPRLGEGLATLLGESLGTAELTTEPLGSAALVAVSTSAALVAVSTSAALVPESATAALSAVATATSELAVNLGTADLYSS